VVKIRLQKLGRRNRAFFRIVVSDARVKRQGLYLEKVGQYDPIEKNEEKALLINTERCQHWINQGAQPTEAVAHLLKKKGMVLSKPTPATPKAAKKPAAAKK
jgi:small subunit ribosomal protein S16